MREQDDRGRITLSNRKTLENVARSLFKTNLTDIQISEHTLLPIEQIEKLRAEK